MYMKNRYYLLALILLPVFTSPVSAQTETIEIMPSLDNTLYESAAGDLSNGQGEYLFIGRTNQPFIRRAILYFDIAGELPDNARVLSAELRVNVSKAVGGPQPATVHEVLRSWGEGDSNASGAEGEGGTAANGDATWLHTFYPDQNWQVPGGDYAGTILMETTIDGEGQYSFESTQAFVLLIQEWQTSPETNFGIMIRGNEARQRVAKRLDSRHRLVEDNRPRLVIEYELVATSLEPVEEIASEFRILENYPNPFNPETTIRYSVDSPGEAIVAVYNLMGQEVWRERRIHSRSGTYEARFNALNLGSGIYLARILQNNRYSNVIKMTLLK
jgi:hypothetical protein